LWRKIEEDREEGYDATFDFREMNLDRRGAIDNLLENY